MRHTHYIAALYILLNLLPALAVAQDKKDDVTYKDRQKFERLYIDASKSKLLEDYQQAIKLYENCKKIDDKAPAVYYELANLYLHLGRLEDALENAKAASGMEPDNIYYRIIYGECLKTAKNLKDASSVYRDIVKDFPSQYGAYIDLAMIYIASKQPDKAIDVYNDLEKHFGPVEEVKLKKQFLFIQQGQVEKAAREVQDLIDLHPEEVRYYVLLAELYSANDMEDKAARVYEETSAKFPKNGEIQLSLGDYFTRRKQYKKGLEHYKSAFSNPDLNVDAKVQALLNLFDVANQDGGYSDDIEGLGLILLESHPGDARALTINGDIQNNLGKKAKAREYFKSAVKKDESRYPIWSQLLILDAELDYFDSLIEDGAGAARSFPNQPLCYYFQGYGYQRKGENAQAATTYEMGLALVIENDALKLQFLIGLGDAYNEIGDFDKSDKAFDKAIKIDPNNTIVLNNYSYYLSVRGEKLDKALEMSGKTLKLEGKSSTYLDTYAWILYKMERYEEAREYLQKALDGGGVDSGVILEHMGDVCFKLGETEKAMEYWKQASEKEDVSDLLQKKLKEGQLYE